MDAHVYIHIKTREDNCGKFSFSIMVNVIQGN
jgi:hypothetical protein